MHTSERDQTETIVQVSGVNTRRCMKCGKCSGACPSFEEMDIHPHMFVTMVDEGRVEELLQSKSIWKCLSCFACVERCPRDVKPAMLVEAVRLMVIREKGENYMDADDLAPLLEENLPQQAIVSAFRKYSK